MLLFQSHFASALPLSSSLLSSIDMIPGAFHCIGFFFIDACFLGVIFLRCLDHEYCRITSGVATHVDHVVCFNISAAYAVQLFLYTFRCSVRSLFFRRLSVHCVERNEVLHHQPPLHPITSLVSLSHVLSVLCVFTQAAQRTQSYTCNSRQAHDRTPRSYLILLPHVCVWMRALRSDGLSGGAVLSLAWKQMLSDLRRRNTHIAAFLSGELHYHCPFVTSLESATPILLAAGCDGVFATRESADADASLEWWMFVIVFISPFSSFSVSHVALVLVPLFLVLVMFYFSFRLPFVHVLVQVFL